DSNSAVLIALHPSLTGIKTETGISGSTAWHNTVRARAYLTSHKENSEDDKDRPDTGLRQLDFKKNNYGPISASVTLQWKTIGQAGVYLPTPSGSGGLDKVAADANKARKGALAAAMNRLFDKKIKVETYGRPSRRYNKIVEQESPDNKNSA